MGAPGLEVELGQSKSGRHLACGRAYLAHFKLQARNLGSRTGFDCDEGSVRAFIFLEVVLPSESSSCRPNIALKPGEVGAGEASFLELLGQSLRRFGAFCHAKCPRGIAV